MQRLVILHFERRNVQTENPNSDQRDVSRYGVYLESRLVVSRVEHYNTANESMPGVEEPVEAATQKLIGQRWHLFQEVPHPQTGEPLRRLFEKEN